MITSVNEYLEKLKIIEEKINSLKEDDRQQSMYSIFFRGVSSKSYAGQEHDKPSIYRKLGHIRSEHIMYYELISKCVDEFKDCHTTFEHLVKMQHYGFPTRLLDITSNALVALYFACLESTDPELDKNGQVIVYKVLSTEICNYESDRVSLLSNLTRSNPKCNYVDFIVNELLKELTSLGLSLEEYSSSQEGYRQFDHAIESMMNTNSIKHLNHELFKIYTSNEKIELPSNSSEIIQQLNKFLNSNVPALVGTLILDVHAITSIPILGIVDTDLLKKAVSTIKLYQKKFGNYFSRYSYSIRNEKIGFNSDLIIADHIKTVQFVRPKLTNPRIVAQSGLFILFGLNPIAKDKCEVPIINDKFYVMNDDDTSVEIVIDCEAKEKIIKELSMLGIMHSTLFPEISDVAREVSDRYQNT